MARPFDENPIGSRYRERYGQYRSRYARLKVGSQAYQLHADADGTNWVKVDWSAGGDGNLQPTIHDIAIYKVMMWKNGGWAGEALWRLTIDDVKVYPFQAQETVVDAVEVYLSTLSTTVKTGEVCDLQFKSTNAGDTGGGGQDLFARVYYAELREV
jgi:hypothetical protein